MRGTLLTPLASLALALVLLTSPARAELRRSGVPLLAEHSSGTAADGSQVSAWRVLFFLYTNVDVTRPSGQTASRWSFFPFVRHTENSATQGSSWTILPLAHISRDAAGHFHIVPIVPPAIWYDHETIARGHSRGFFSLLPLIWFDHRRMLEYRSDTTLVFPFYRLTVHGEASGEVTESVDVSNWGLWPFTWGWTNGAFDHLNVFYPLINWEPGRKLHIFPILWWGEGYFSIAPLWGRYEFTHQEESELTGGLVAIRERFQYWLFPLFVDFEQQRADIETPYVERHVLWPIFAWGDGGGRTERRVFPLWRQATTELGEQRRETTWALTPLFWHGRIWQGAWLLRAHDVVFPLAWDLRWVEGSREAIEDEGDFGVIPADHRLRILFPFVIHHEVDQQPRSLWVLWPLFYALWGEEGPDPQTPVFAWRAGMFLSGYTREISGDNVFDIVGWLFRRERQGEAVRTNTLLWTFTTERDPEADRARAALLWRLVEYTREGQDRGLRLFYLPWRIPLG